MNDKDLLVLAAKANDDKRAEDMVVLNMQGISPIADYFIICHGIQTNKCKQLHVKLNQKHMSSKSTYNVWKGLTKHVGY